MYFLLLYGAALSAVAGRVYEKMMHLSTVFFVGSSLSATVKIVIFAVGRMLPGKESFFRFNEKYFIVNKLKTCAYGGNIGFGRTDY